MKSMFNYVNRENDLCEVLIDDKRETAYVLNTNTLEVFKTNHVDGTYGLLSFINEDIDHIYEIKMNQLEHALRFMEDNDCTEDCPVLYKIFSGAWLDMKGE